MMAEEISYAAMGHGANGIFWLLLIVLFFWLYYVFINRNNNSEHQTPLELIEKKYIEGKISHEEFKKISKQLKQDSQ